MFQPFSQFGICGSPKPSQQMNDAGNRAKPAPAKEEDGGEQSEDSSSSATDNAWSVKDFETFFHGWRPRAG